jgi:DNA processing protein
MFAEEHLYSIALRRCSLIGDINFRRLVQHFGTAEKVWKTKPSLLCKIDGIGSKTIAEIGKIEHLKFAEKEIEFCRKKNLQISIRHLQELPILLNECEDAPAILYHFGDFDKQRKSISIVGTRHATAYGKKFVEELLSALPAQKACTVSGLALGIDTEVHEQSLHNHLPTIAILAHGFQTLYPSKNAILAEKILEKGGMLVSEFNSTQKPDRENFIQRNRIVAGLSKATIVAETAFGGGSVSTVTFANNYNRDIYALPGKITDKYSQGCNQLIYQNKATAISTIPTLMEELGFNQQEKVGNLFANTETFPLTEQQKIVFEQIIASSPISLDDLGEKLQLPTHQLLGVLLELELMSRIKPTSSRQYSPC